MLVARKHFRPKTFRKLKGLLRIRYRVYLNVSKRIYLRIKFKLPFVVLRMFGSLLFTMLNHTNLKIEVVSIALFY